MGREGREGGRDGREGGRRKGGRRRERDGMGREEKEQQTLMDVPGRFFYISLSRTCDNIMRSSTLTLLEHVDPNSEPQFGIQFVFKKNSLLLSHSGIVGTLADEQWATACQFTIHENYYQKFLPSDAKLTIRLLTEA
jgi:hypothetical protein